MLSEGVKNENVKFLKGDRCMDALYVKTWKGIYVYMVYTSLLLQTYLNFYFFRREETEKKRINFLPQCFFNVFMKKLFSLQGDDFEEPITEEMLGAASSLIREWAESLLKMKFSTLSALARYLVENLRVDTRSLAAVCILCASSDTQTSTNNKGN